MIFDAGLILEGGGMRGVYTAGVLDCFMDNEIWISHCYGVSAGAVNATNYLSKQRGRTFRVTADYINDKCYCSVKNLLTTGDLFGADFLYNRIPNELDPFDYDAFEKSDTRMTALLGRLLYSHYPRTLEAGKRRHLMYNRQLSLVAEQERLGNALVLRPKEPVTIGRAEKDRKKLTALYEQGYANAKEKLNEIMEFLEIRESVLGGF